MKSHIEKLIEQGEHQQLDFKFEVSDSRKIARTLVAFANTDGGKLLIGVKDNGKIAGIRSDEEFYMIEGAASLYCKPEVKFKTTNWNINGKTVLEIDIFKNTQTKHSCKDEQGNWMKYVRVKDQNLLANSVLLKIWEREKNRKAVLIRYSETEKILLDYFEENESISVSKFCKLAQIPRKLAEKILVDLISLNVLELEISELSTVFKLKE